MAPSALSSNRCSLDQYITHKIDSYFHDARSKPIVPVHSKSSHIKINFSCNSTTHQENKKSEVKIRNVEGKDEEMREMGRLYELLERDCEEKN